MRRPLVKQILLLFLLLALPAHAAEPHTQSVAIGIIAPLTGSNADRGAEIQRTLATFEALLKQRPTRFNYRFLLDDGQCGLGNASTTAAQRFITVENAAALIAGCSGETIQAGQIGQRAGVVVIGVIASSPEVKNLGDYVFRTYVDIEQGIAEIAALIRKRHSRVAVLSEEVPFTLAIEQQLSRQLASKIIFQEQLPAESDDFAALLSRAKQVRPDAFYLNCSAARPTANLVNRLRALGFEQPLYSYFMPGEPQFREAVKENAEGITYLDTPPVQSASGEFAQFLAEYRRQFAREPGIDFIARTTHDAILALVNAVEAAGPERSAIKTHLEHTSFEGALGRVEFDKNGDVRDLRFVIKQIQAGNPVVLKNSD